MPLLANQPTNQPTSKPVALRRPRTDTYSSSRTSSRERYLIDPKTSILYSRPTSAAEWPQPVGKVRS